MAINKIKTEIPTEEFLILTKMSDAVIDFWKSHDHNEEFFRHLLIMHLHKTDDEIYKEIIGNTSFLPIYVGSWMLSSENWKLYMQLFVPYKLTNIYVFDIDGDRKWYQYSYIYEPDYFAITADIIKSLDN